MAHTPGRFVWRERVTTDPERAQSFYSSLFGWSWDVARSADGTPYPLAHVDGQPVAGLWQPPPGATMPAAWMSYLSVDDVERATRTAQELGWTVGRPPTDIPGVGRFSVLADFAGAWVLPFRSANGDAPPDPASVGAFCWESLLTSDVPRAVSEYGRLAGWKRQVSPNGLVPVFAVDDTPTGRVADVQEAGGRPPCWLTYVRVQSAADSAAHAATIGGRILVPTFTIPQVGSIAFIGDPDGAILGLFQPPAPN